MAIAVMRKLRLAAIAYDRDSILNALQKTGAVEVKLLNEAENTHRPASDAEALFAYLEQAEAALEELSSSCDRYAKENKIKYDRCKDGFIVSYDEFMDAAQKKQEADGLIAAVERLQNERAALQTELTKIIRERATAKPYERVCDPLNSFRDTARTKVYFGTLALQNAQAVAAPFSAMQVLGEGERPAVLVVSHRSVREETEELLRGASYSECPYRTDERTGAELNAYLENEEKRIRFLIKENAEKEFALADKLHFLKVYCDRAAYELEKAQLSEKLLATERTVLLEAYIPAGAEEMISAALNEVSDSVYYDFIELDEGEMPPTLMKNNKLVQNFEAVTNLYSPPNAKEFDPSAVMGFFYSVFLGFIMADIGYGILMCLGGGFLWWKNRVRDNGMKRLAAVFCIGGVFTVFWGFLFNSLFGVGILPVRVMPVLLGAEANWTFIGISIPALLIIAMELGILQLFAGYVCRAIQAWRRGKVWDGIFDGLPWAVFSAGVIIAIIGLVKEANLPVLTYVGGIMAGAGLVIAMLTAGRKEKFIGKFTKGFGAAYGVISYASDILSYARLYGLMLSGAVISEIITGYALTGYPVGSGATGMIMSGNVGLIILGVVLLLLGHVLNLALSLLGAYIHDARLQYVEFYGKFYEGEGELFAPIGSRHQHVFIAPRAEEKPLQTAENKS